MAAFLMTKLNLGDRYKHRQRIESQLNSVQRN